MVEQAQENKKDKKEHVTNTVLVVGGTGGIGSATCVQLAKDGFDVAIHYHKNKSKANQLKDYIVKNGQKAVVVSGNIEDQSDINKIKEQSQRIIGEISVVVNCATIPIPTIRFSDLEWDDMQAHYDTNI